LIANYAHVKGAQKIRALFSDGRVVDASSFIGSDDTGLALLKTEKPLAKSQPVVRFAAPDSGKVGDKIKVVRKPPKGKTDLIVVDGKVVALGQKLTLQKRVLNNLLRVDQHVQGGSPVFNAAGELLGLGDSPMTGSMGGFVVPAKTVHDAWRDLRNSFR
jgi:S1-C subfamily serine protease